MASQTVYNPTPDPTAARWIDIIALWVLVMAGLNLFFWGLVQLSWLKGSFSAADHIDILGNSFIGIFIAHGFRRHAAWSWKLAVIAIPCSWLYGIYDISQDYQPGMGFITGIFVLIDSVIVTFLFTPAVAKLFHINTFWSNLAWLKYPLLVTGVFLLGFDIFGNIGGIVSGVAVFVGIKFWERYRCDSPTEE
jgi:hypothetical protein